ncbi:hypothetical protein PCANB_001127 [Pneumocystis canis]|nr:hypothetical protein PCK1_001139 [Pneumocystis canis]KAG5437151.1 hypothetical protein PCANB_001127 [Pneumocystis canis]
MSNQSITRLIKALHHLFSSSEILKGLPSDINDKISQYLKKHDIPDLIEIQKLQEQLLNVYYTKVKHKDISSHELFMCCLQKFQSLLIGKEFAKIWWNIIIKLTFNSFQQMKSILSNAESILLTMMIIEDDLEERFRKEKQESSEIIKKCLFEFYLDKSKEVFSYELGNFFIEEDKRHYISSNIESILIGYAKRRTKVFLNDIDVYFVQKKYRLQILSLLCTFVRLQGPHLYTIFETSLFENLLRCLENDSSTTVISLSLTVLIMFMPHICNLLGKYLPRIFKIYVRVLCWDRFGAVQKHDDFLDNEIKTQNEKIMQIFTQTSDGWEKLDSLFDISPSIPLNCSQFFTFIYGLYPVNFLKFLHGAQTYLQENNDEYYMYFDDDMIKSRSEPLIKRHIIHPNLLLFTFETEITDQTRWMKLEIADIVAKCVSLDIFNTPHLCLRDISLQCKQKYDISSGNVYNTDLTCLDNMENKFYTNCFKTKDEFNIRQLRDSFSMANLNQNCFASHAFFSSSEKNLLLQHDLNLSQYVAPIKLEDMMRIHEKLNSDFGVYSARISEIDQINAITDLNSFIKSKESLILKPGMEKSTDSPLLLPFFSKNQEYCATVALLKREILLLQNELNFEKHLKFQHLHHLRRLKREHILDSSVEAERQNLYNTTRTLKSRLINLQSTFEKLRSEAITRQNQRIERETELNTKLKSLHEEYNHLKDNYNIVKEKLEESKKNISYLSTKLQNSNSEKFKLNQELKELKAEQLKTRKAELISGGDNDEQKNNQFEKLLKEKENLLENANKTIFILNQRLHQKEHEFDTIKSQYNLLLIKSMNIPFNDTIDTDAIHLNVLHENNFSRLNNKALLQEFNYLENAHQKLLLDYRTVQSEVVSMNATIEILQQKIAQYESRDN